MKEKKCVAGCRVYDGDETYHHEDCDFYKDSFSSMYDNLKKEVEQLRAELERKLKG